MAKSVGLGRRDTSGRLKSARRDSLGPRASTIEISKWNDRMEDPFLDDVTVFRPHGHEQEYSR
jgi:hypothetical protein